MLNIKTRQKYLKSLGFYNGIVDNIEGPVTRKAYLELQKKYFDSKDVDGIYGKYTDILLIDAYLVWKYCKNFSLPEFKCECNSKYCTGYPAKLDKNILIYLQKLRNIFNQPVYITSGLRCNIYNNTLTGSILNSKHTKGKAIDFSCKRTSVLQERKKIINYYMTMEYASYSYCNGYWKNKNAFGSIRANYMYNSIHIDVF